MVSDKDWYDDGVSMEVTADCQEGKLKKPETKLKSVSVFDPECSSQRTNFKLSRVEF